MIVLSWNCRGLGHLSAVPSLRDLVRCHKPNIVFLCETLSNQNKVHEVRRSLVFDACFIVDKQGRSGGLAILWRKGHMCEVQNYSMNFINVVAKDVEQQPCRLTGYYGKPH